MSTRSTHGFRIRDGLRLSIRYKILLVVAVTVLLAVGSYGYLAVSLFTQDKLAYVYDLNAAVVANQSTQVRANLAVLNKALRMFALETQRTGKNSSKADTVAESLFGVEPDLLNVELYDTIDETGITKPYARFVNGRALAATMLTENDLGEIRRLSPIPWRAVIHSETGLIVQNSSLQPNAAILSVVLRTSEGQGAIVADMRYERFANLFSPSKLYITYLVDQQGTVLVHPNSSWVLEKHNLSKTSLVSDALKGTIERGVKEFTENDGNAYIGAFAGADVGRLWVFTQLPKAEALRAAEQLTRRTILFAIAVLLGAFIASIFLSRFVTSPIRRLRAATDLLAQGQFDVQVNVNSNDEIGDLARAFSRMTHELKEVQTQLIQSEKMAAFGQLGAGITHEVRNPIGGIVNLAQLAIRQMDNPSKVTEHLKLIESEGRRCNEILNNLLKFARASDKNLDALDVNSLVQHSAAMLRHQLGVNRVTLRIDAASDLPKIKGNGSELQQVLLNLSINAQQAMSNGGIVTISTRREDNYVVIAVSDTGHGIPAHLQQRIFEPFFTTKPAGSGTGLGLSVSFNIVKAHHGLLTVKSAPNEGATFSIKLPIEKVSEEEIKK